MKHVRVLVLALFAVFVIAAVASATASAETLPYFTPTTATGTGTSGAGVLTAGSTKINCKKGSNSVGAATRSVNGERPFNLGQYTTDFKECTLNLGEQCHSLGDEHGVILLQGEYHLVTIDRENRAGGEKLAGVWFLLPAGGLHLECELLATLIIVTGNVLGLIANERDTEDLRAGARFRRFSILVVVKEERQANTVFLNNEGREVKASLITKVNEGAETASTEESAENAISLNEEVELLFH
jgi:hypothetical protein